MKRLILFLLLAVLTASNPLISYAQEPENIDRESLKAPKEIQLEAEILEVSEEKVETVYGTEQISQVLKVRILSPEDRKGDEITISTDSLSSAQQNVYEVGEKVIVAQIEGQDGSQLYFVLDYVRKSALLWLSALFLVVTFLVARWKGVASILGMIYSFFIIFAFILPQLLAGQNPIPVAIIGGMLIVPVTFYVSHGFNRKTHTAVVGTLISLLITSILAYFSIEGSHLTGFASEDATFLKYLGDGSLNIKGILLAGIIVGLFGILDDVTISQASVVFALKETNPNLTFKELYAKSMSVGKDHIGSLVNTIILVYTGAALPFLLLLIASGQPFGIVINYEIVSEEIVRTLTASIGLILAVPITTFIAASQAK